MDVYWINCFLACSLSFILGMMYAERKFKKLLSNMLSGRMQVSGVSNDTKSNS